MKRKIFRAVIEMCFIIFLFYSNLLMGEYEHNGIGLKNNFVWAFENIFTLYNFSIAIVTSFIGYIFFEYLRKKF